MKVILNPHAVTAADASEAKPAVEVAALYADTACAEKAGQIYTDFLPSISPGREFNCSWWTFEKLLQPDTFQIAALEGTRADVLVIAAHASQELPALVKAWVDLSAGESRKGDRMLVGLLGGQFAKSRTQELSLDAFLQAIARRAGIRYLPYWFQLADGNAAAASAIREKATGITTALLSQSFPKISDIRDWGINE
jgi:hypothetical protein